MGIRRLLLAGMMNSQKFLGSTDIEVDTAVNAIDVRLAVDARHRASEIDAAYGAYDRIPIQEPDEWGDLASFSSAAGSS